MARLRKTRVVILAVSITFVYLAGTALADPLLAEAMGLDVWHIGRLERELIESRSREHKLESDFQAVLDRTAVHNHMLEDMAFGRVSLVVTARRKWEMNQNRDVIRQHLTHNRSGSSMEARMAHDLVINAIDKFGREIPAETREAWKAEYKSEYDSELPLD